MSFNAFRVSNRFTISPYLYAGEQEELLTPVIYKLIAATRKRVRQSAFTVTSNHEVNAITSLQLIVIQVLFFKRGWVPVELEVQTFKFHWHPR